MTEANFDELRRQAIAAVVADPPVRVNNFGRCTYLLFKNMETARIVGAYLTVMGDTPPYQATKHAYDGDVAKAQDIKGYFSYVVVGPRGLVPEAINHIIEEDGRMRSGTDAVEVYLRSHKDCHLPEELLPDRLKSSDDLSRLRHFLLDYATDRFFQDAQLPITPHKHAFDNGFQEPLRALLGKAQGDVAFQATKRQTHKKNHTP